MDAFNTNIASLLIWIELKLVDLISQTQCQIKDVSNSKKKNPFSNYTYYPCLNFFSLKIISKVLPIRFCYFFKKKLKYLNLAQNCKVQNISWKVLRKPVTFNMDKFHSFRQKNCDSYYQK